MLRFLRKYNKLLLVVAGSALMVLFLLPQAVQQLGPNQLNEVVFRIDGHAFRGKDVQAAQAKLGAIQALERTAAVPYMFNVRFESLEHWMLLVQEAKAHGLVAGGGIPEDLMATLANQRAQQFRAFNAPAEQIAALEAEQRAITYAELTRTLEEQRARIGEQRVSEAVAEAYGVRRLLELFGGFATISTPEAAIVAVKALDTAFCDIAFVDYTEVLADVDAPTDAELQAHFDEYKDIDARQNTDGIGYRLWDAVTLEAVEIDLAKIRAALVLDEIEVNKRWRQNKASYGDTFASVKSVVESDIRDERLAAIVRTIEELGRRELLRETRDLAADAQGFKVLPDDWSDRQADFAQLAAQINAEIAKAVTLDDPAANVTQLFGWSNARDLSEKSMGRAFATIRGQSVSLPNLAMSVRELQPETKTGMQTGVAFGPLMIPRERMVFLRVLDARPAGPPATLDEVKLRAREDWKKLRAREMIAERTEEIRQTVIAAERADAIIASYRRPLLQLGVEVTRGTAKLAGNTPATVANTPAMRNAIMDVVATWDPTVPVLSRPIEERVVATPLPDDFGVGVALITGRYPVTVEAMRTTIAPLSQQYALDLYASGQSDPPFTFERLKQRLGYVVPEGRTVVDPDDETEEAPTETE